MRLKTTLRFYVVFLLGLLLTTGSLAEEQKMNPVVMRIANRQLSVSFSKSKGLLLELTDLENRMNFVGRGYEEMGLWELEFRSGSNHPILTPSRALAFKGEPIGNEKLGLQLTWEGFGLSEAPDLRVSVIVNLDRDKPMSYWTIGLEGLGELRLERVKFPRIINITHQEDERLAVPAWMGQLATNPREIVSGSHSTTKRVEWAYPGALSLQCLAFYREEGSGLYLSCDDTAVHRKAFAVWGGPGSDIHYEMCHFPESQIVPKESYSLPYHAVIGTFRGDWITAAERYRAWGTRQIWARESRLSKGLVPDWLFRTGMWVWNRGRSEMVLGPASVMQKELGLPVSVLWHWWHGCAYDSGFPEYFPPREGTEPFKQALQKAHEIGIKAMVYMNARLWGMTTRSWLEKGAERYAVKNADGTIRPEVYNIFTGQPCASMCIATPFWRETYANLAEEAIRDLGTDGIYMDQACTNLPCYDPAHGHPVGGGMFWMNGFRLLSEDIRKRAKGLRNILLAGEGAGEAWLPYLDLMLTLQVSRERYETPNDGWEVIPFFQAVYHPYGITYGNYSSLTFPPYDELWPAEFAPKEPMKLLDRRFSKQFILEQARAFVWGLQPTIANFLPSHLRDRREEIDYAIKLARIRDRGKKYLQHGTFLRSPAMNIPEEDVDISRLSIYAGRKEGEVSWKRKFPAAVTGTWRARDGDVGIAVASISASFLPIRLHFDSRAYGLGRKGFIFQIDEKGRKLIGRFEKSKVIINFLLPAQGARIVELTRRKDQGEPG